MKIPVRTGIFLLRMDALHLNMRRLLFLVFAIAMVSGSCDNPVSYPDMSYHDSILNANYFDSLQRVEESSWKKYDSLPGTDIELWRREGPGNNYYVELRFNLDGDRQRLRITDSLPSYRYENESMKHLETAQLNGTGRDELLICLGGYYSAATP